MGYRQCASAADQSASLGFAQKQPLKKDRRRVTTEPGSPLQLNSGTLSFSQALIDQVPDYLWIKDTDHRFAAVNKALVEDAGRASAMDFIGRTDFDIFEPGLARQYRANDKKVLEEGAPLIDCEEAVLDHTGRLKWVLTTKTPLRDATGRIVGLIGISRDVTQRRNEQLRQDRGRRG